MSVKVQDCECGNLVQVGMKACPFCGRQRESEGVVVDLRYEQLREFVDNADPSLIDAWDRLTRIDEGEE